MKITQVKPRIAGYHRVKFAGKSTNPVIVWSRDEMQEMAEMDLNSKDNPTGEHSKFRPVYGGNEGDAVDRFSEEWV